VRVVRRSSQNANQSTPFFENPRPPAGGFVKVQAFAKINLFLDVTGKRTDGYHNIVSVMQSVSLCDDLTITIAPNTREVQLFCDTQGLPTDDSNLIVKAANVLIREFDIPHGFKIELTKRIPVGAGLAGGSSNCAATLRGINRLCNLNIPLPRLLEIGKALGADVPFCLTGGTALTEGIGEKITPLTPHPPCFIVIANPNIHISTAEIFSRLGGAFGDGDEKSTAQILSAILKKDLQQIATSFYNIFTPFTSAIHPAIHALISQLKSIGALNAEMTGTGSSVFAYFSNEDSAQKAFTIMKQQNTAFLCKPKN